MVRGRRTDHDQLIDRLDLAAETKERLRRILATLSGRQTVVEACGYLGVSERHFHALRAQFLQDAGRCLERRPAGRPRRSSSGTAAQVAVLQAELQQEPQLPTPQQRQAASHLKRIRSFSAAKRPDDCRRRGLAGQLPRRAAERRVRRTVLAFRRWTRQLGWTRQQTARQLGMAASTLAA
jgi:hypothetical protein